MIALYEDHGWATLRQSWGDEDGEEEQIRTIAENLRQFLAERQWGTGLIDLRAVNGQYLFSMAGATNHRPTSPHDPVDWLRYVGQVAPGSYGTLYIWDDEDQGGFSNAFQVYVMARGQVRQHKDPFLSPCIPIIEDPPE
jgi:hypothetical protein